jgi:hypothetical protein
VARVQKNSLSLQDLIKHTPEGSADHAALSESLLLIQNFLNEYNLGMFCNIQVYYQFSTDPHRVRRARDSSVVGLQGHYNQWNVATSKINGMASGVLLFSQFGYYLLLRLQVWG